MRFLDTPFFAVMFASVLPATPPWHDGGVATGCSGPEPEPQIVREHEAVVL